ncbi:MAG: YceI family protein [Phycisphaerales bacterium]|nr:YceI family protein [Phycisphaerales bacterium]
MKSNSLLIILALGLSVLMFGALTTQDTPTDEASKAPAVQGDFVIDTVHSTAIFRVLHRGAGNFYGRFNDVSGTITYTPGSKDGLALDVSIAIDSVDTANERLDGHLKSPDFFNALEFPAMTFKSSKAELIKPDVYRVTGELALHGTMHPITVDMVRTGISEGRRGTVVGFETSFTIKRSMHEMNYGIENGALGDDVTVIVAMEAIAK